MTRHAGAAIRGLGGVAAHSPAGTGSAGKPVGGADGHLDRGVHALLDADGLRDLIARIPVAD